MERQLAVEDMAGGQAKGLLEIPGRHDVFVQDQILQVGRVLGKAALGVYELGWTLATIPVDRVSALVARVIPSVLSAVQNDRAALRRYCLGLTEGLAFIALPLATGMALTADHFVLLLRRYPLPGPRIVHSVYKPAAKP